MTNTRARFNAYLAVAGLAVAMAGCGDTTDQQTVAQAVRECRTLDDDPVRMDGGTFAMGQTDVYPEEGPIRETTVSGFWIDPHEVTNRQFAAFVDATGYVTTAEKPVDPALFNVPVDQIPAFMLEPGSAVFTPPTQPANSFNDWWAYTPGASWKKPYGPDGEDYAPDEPVVHLSYEDMQAYADWRGGRIPTEAEWEFAARAGEPNYTDQPVEANTWQGAFPAVNEETDGFARIAPVGCFEANQHGLYDMVGNAWEMTADLYTAGHDPNDRVNPRGPSENAAYDPYNPDFTSRVIKGGSYLCAPNYCRRYRPAARTGRDPSMGASNVGFRLVYDELPVS